MWNIQEQEEIDYQIGAASELQNAYAWNSMNRKQDDPRIQQELKKGRFVIVEEGTDYCPSTDAIMGSHKEFASAHNTREEAEATLAKEAQDPEINVYILPYKQVAPDTTTYDRDEIPF